MKLIDGRIVSAAVRERIRKDAISLPRPPKLVAMLVGDDPASAVYVRNKHKACSEVGFLSEVITLPANSTAETVFGKVDEFNRDPIIDGILIQLPLPKHLPEKELIDRVAPEKDADGFSAMNAGKFYLSDYPIKPCTPYGVMEMLRYYQIETAGKHAVVIGRSNIVGKPIALMLLSANSTVTIAHSKTPNLADVCRTADILVAAVGRPEFITGDMVKPGAVVIDVGINRVEGNEPGKTKLVGDVHFESASQVASWITPVPGGVGPMTITMLLQNTLTLSKWRQGK